MTPHPKAGSRLRPTTVGVSRGGNPAVEDVRKRDRKACSIATGVTIGAVKAGELLVDKHPDRACRVKDLSQTRHGAGIGSGQRAKFSGAAELQVSDKERSLKRFEVQPLVAGVHEPVPVFSPFGVKKEVLHADAARDAGDFNAFLCEHAATEAMFAQSNAERMSSPRTSAFRTSGDFAAALIRLRVPAANLHADLHAEAAGEVVLPSQGDP